MELNIKKTKLESNTNKVRLRILNKMLKDNHTKYLSLKKEIKSISENIVFLKQEHQIAITNQKKLDLLISNSIETSTQDLDENSIIICQQCKQEHYIGEENITTGLHDTYFSCSNCYSKIILFSNPI